MTLHVRAAAPDDVPAAAEALAGAFADHPWTAESSATATTSTSSTSARGAAVPGRTRKSSSARATRSGMGSR